MPLCPDGNYRSPETIRATVTSARNIFGIIEKELRGTNRKPDLLQMAQAELRKAEELERLLK